RGGLPGRGRRKPKWGFTFDPVGQYQKDLGPMVREKLWPDRLRRSGIFNPELGRAVLTVAPQHRLRWHYFMLWQMIGVETWLETFAQGQAVPARRAAVEGA